MKLLFGTSGLLLAAILAFGAVAPALADDATSTTTTTTDGTTTTVTTDANATPMTVSGKVSEPNFQAKIFWITPNGQPSVGVVAGDANIQYNGQTANVYRMMGTPTVTATGTMRGNLLYATAVTITSGPAARLQQSSYTDQAVPAFGANDLVPLHVGDGSGTATTTTTVVTPPATTGTTAPATTTHTTHTTPRHTSGGHHGNNTGH